MRSWSASQSHRDLLNGYKLYNYILSYVFILLVTTSCNINPGIKNEVQKSINEENIIISFGAQEQNRELYRPIIEKFNQANSHIKVQFTPLDPPNGSPQEILQATASKVDTTVITYLDRGGMDSNILYNLLPFINTDTSFNRSDFYPGILNLFRGCLKITRLRPKAILDCDDIHRYYQRVIEIRLDRPV